MLGLSSIFLFNFFYMYFANRPRPALTAVIQDQGYYVTHFKNFGNIRYCSLFMTLAATILFVLLFMLRQLLCLPQNHAMEFKTSKVVNFDKTFALTHLTLLTKQTSLQKRHVGFYLLGDVITSKMHIWPPFIA